jgi:DNA polymerase III alpha subunit
MEISFMGPDINKSGQTFERYVLGNDGYILLELSMIKGLGDAAATNILSGSDQNGPYAISWILSSG